jgi:hypothetical protein
MSQHKDQVIEAAIQGLNQGGFSDQLAETFKSLLSTVYDAGYNEAIRVIQSKPNPGYSDIKSTGGPDPRHKPRYQD